MHGDLEHHPAASKTLKLPMVVDLNTAEQKNRETVVFISFVGWGKGVFLLMD